MICVSALVLLASISGCASFVAKVPPTVLLQDEKIYTVPAGQKISVELDHKPMELVFPYPMKLMSIDRAIRDEQMKNDAALKAVSADAKNKKMFGIVATIIGIIGSIFGIVFFKKIKWPTFKLNAEVK